ncbi:MAG: MerR family transcriptional regulator [bacterium]
MVERYHSVTAVCRLLKVEPHILRYWEREFDLKVKRNSAGRRIYSDDQLEKLRLIKHMVRREGLTVEGARRRLARPRAKQQALDFKDDRAKLLALKRELLAIRGLLEPGD